MAVKWVINFGTLGQNCTVSIEDRSYSGSPISLTPASNPLTLSRKQTDFYQPILNESGLISIIDTGDSSLQIENIHPLNAFARPVTITYNNQIYWRGYLSPEALTTDYGPAPRTISFPMVGMFDVLSSITLSGNDNQLRPIAYYLYYCLQQTGFSWSNIYMPPQLYAIIDTSLQLSYGIPELRLCVSFYNFFNENKAVNVYETGYSQLQGVSWYDCLKIICQYFGWTIIADGTDIYLSSPNVSLPYPVKLTKNELQTIALSPLNHDINPYSGSTVRPSINLTALSWAGINHRKTIYNGYKRLTINHAPKSPACQYPKITFQGDVDNSVVLRANPGSMMQYCLLGSVEFLDPSKEKVTLHSYIYNTSTSAFEEITWAPYVRDTGKSTPRADIVRAYSDMLPWPTEPDDIENKDKFIRICRAYYPGTDSGKKILGSSYALATISALATGLYPANGALCLSGKVRSNYLSTSESDYYIDHEGLTDYRYFSGYLKMSIKIGGRYFNGTSWQGTSTTVSVQVENGIIKNTNTHQQYQNAEGYIMPIPKDYYGKIEITLFPWANNTNEDTLFIQNLEVNYYNDDLPDNSNDANMISGLTGTDFSDDKQTTMSLVAAKNIIMSPSVLFWNGSPIGKKQLFYPYWPDTTTVAMPEEVLLEAMKTVYSKPSTWLTLETVFDSSIKMWTIVNNNNPVNPDNKKYIIVGMETDFADNTTKLYLATYQ